MLSLRAWLLSEGGAIACLSMRYWVNSPTGSSKSVDVSLELSLQGKTTVSFKSAITYSCDPYEEAFSFDLFLFGKKKSRAW